MGYNANLKLCSLSHLSGILLLFISIRHSICTKQVFKNYPSCDLLYDDNTFTVPDRTWEISSKDNQKLQFSFCQQTAYLLYPNKTSTILATKFSQDTDEYGLPVLKSTGGTKCNVDEYYNVFITFECLPSTKTVPVMSNEENPCEYHIKVMKPDCVVPCTFRENDKLIDLRPTLRSTTNTIHVRFENEYFGLSLCGAPTICRNRTIGACKVNNSQIIPLLHVETKHLVYNADENQLAIKGYYRYGTQKHDRYNVQITLKCNWTTNIGEAKYINGTAYKFIVESSYGCVKFPMNCKLADVYNGKYDLTGLYKIKDYWDIRNKLNKRLLMNMCGGLNLPPGNPCSETDAQVCEIYGNQQYQSKGSLYKKPTVQSGHLQFKFTDGAVCEANKSKLLESHVDFLCSFNESGPTLVSDSNCTTYIKWETPVACPYYEYVGNECIMRDMFGTRDLNALYNTSDYVHKLDVDSYIRYNLCGPLIEPCGGFSNVSVCLVYRNRQYILGWLNTTLENKNGILQSHMKGGRCSDNTKSEISFFFYCVYASSAQRRDLQIVKDNCIFRVNVYSTAACISSDAIPCITSDDKKEYDLSSLIRDDKNYIVHDTTGSEAVYLINICRPVITTSGDWCHLNTGFCIKNNSDPNIRSRYTSAGEIATPMIKNEQLIIENQGSYCAAGMNYFYSIHFECSRLQEPLSLQSKSRCRYDFIWRTPLACGKQLSNKRSAATCVVENESSTDTLNLDGIKNKTFTVPYGYKSNLTFNICEDSYKECFTDYCKIYHAKRQILIEDRNIYIEVPLHYSCRTGLNSTLKVLLECNTKESKEKHGDIGTCTFAVLPKIKETCEEKFQIQSDASVMKNITLERSLKERYLPSNCSSGSKIFRKYNVTRLKIQGNSGFTYFINYADDFLNCSGRICRNNVAIGLTSSSCVLFLRNDTDGGITISSVQAHICDSGSYYSNISIKCSQSLPTTMIAYESDCSVSIVYYTKHICKNVPEESRTTSYVVISLICIVLLLIVIVSSICVRRHCLSRVRINKQKFEVCYYKDLQS